MSSETFNQQSDSDLETSMGLMRLASGNDPTAWEKIVRIYSPLIGYWCIRMNVARQDVDNIRQEVFVRLAASIGRFRKKAGEEGRSFRGYLRTITQNVVISEYRKRPVKDLNGSSIFRLINNQTSDAGRPSPGQLSMELAILHRRVIQVIERAFSSRDLNIFKASITQDRKASEIATDFGVSTNVVYQVRSRILSYIRDHFGDIME